MNHDQETAGKHPPGPHAHGAQAHGALRLDAALVARGIAGSRTRAHALIKDGAVSVAGEVVTKSARIVGDDVDIALLRNQDHFVSRAAHKLSGFLADLGAGSPVIGGADCLDVGASTGGFTQVLLERGAHRVVAMDVGHGQLDARIASDARVINLEGFNAREMVPGVLPYAPAVIVSDVSFISLTYLLGPMASVISPGGRALILIKPQFEVGREKLGTGGVVRDPALHRSSIDRVLDSASEAGFAIGTIAPSKLPGPAGNLEYFVDLIAPGVLVSSDMLHSGLASGGLSPSDLATGDPAASVLAPSEAASDDLASDGLRLGGAATMPGDSHPELADLADRIAHAVEIGTRSIRKGDSR